MKKFILFLALTNITFYSFSMQQAVSQESLKGTDKKSFKCKLCQYATNDKGNLQKHFRTQKHERKKAAISPENGSSNLLPLIASVAANADPSRFTRATLF